MNIATGSAIATKRVVLSNVGSLGDLHPFIAIALRLKDRGYDAVIATSPDFRDNVVREGIGFHPIGPTRDDMLRDLGIDARELGRRIIKDTLYVLEAGSFPYLRLTYDDLLPVLAGTSLVLAGSLMFPARLAAEKLGIAHMTIALQPMVFLSAYDPPSISQAPWLASPLRRLGPAVTRAVFGAAKLLATRRAGPLYAFRRALGLPDTRTNPLFEGQFSAQGTLATYSPLLGLVQPDYPANTTITGFTFYDRGAQAEPELKSELQKFIAAGPAPLVFTLGSFAVDFPGAFYRVSVEAARRLQQRAILLVGVGRNAAVHQEHSDDVFVCDYAPFSALFPHALINIHHGGIGTTGQALRAAKPQLVVPFLGDQFDNAARLVRLGVARSIAHHQCVAGRVAAELASLLGNANYRTRAAALGREVSREDGTEVIARIVDGLCNPWAA